MGAGRRRVVLRFAKEGTRSSSVVRLASDGPAGDLRDIDGFYNTHRRHSFLGQMSPAKFEERASTP